MSRILLLTPQLPYPPHQGTSLRNFHIIRGLAEQHEITLLSFLESNQTADSAAIEPLLALCAVHTVPVPVRSPARRLWQLVSTRRPDMAHRLYSEAFAIELRRLLAADQFDIVQVEGIELARYMEIVRAVSPTSKIVFDDHNAEAELQRRNFLTDLGKPRRWLAAAYSWVQVGRLCRFERWAMMMADGVTAVSQTDKLALEKLLNGTRTNTDKHGLIAVIPNCIDVVQYQDFADFQKSAKSHAFDLVFIGKMDYRPNVDAVLWFVEEVWLGIVGERPSTKFAIVGQKPHARLERLRDVPGVTLTGWVESVTPYLLGATVFVSPFRIGSGTRLKLIEAMAAGKAIVSTPIGAEGFAVQDGQELLLAETAVQMGTAVLHLLDHPEERERLGQNARQFAQQYDWRQVIPKFEELYRVIV
ncbi:MAG: glycosyltransferase [Ardenticatenaceae bacterium]|nr:glycosyltransferase [Ardenticatenaceae bacterium]MCB9446394.1 glycosyltransferase [Ardenticatenaceae bacterium]